MMHEYLPFMPMWLIEGTAEYTSHLPYVSGRYNVTAAVDAFKQLRRKEKSPLAKMKWIGLEELWGYTTSITERRVITGLTVEPPKPVERSQFRGGQSAVQIQQPIQPPNLSGRYFSSYVTALFFMHLDGDGKGLRLKKYFDAIHEERKLWITYERSFGDYKAAVVRYQEALDVFKKKPGVEVLGGGRIRYPANLVPPPQPALPVGPGNIDPPKVCAKHLGILLDGRSLAELDAEIRAAFAKVGSPL